MMNQTENFQKALDELKVSQNKICKDIKAMRDKIDKDKHYRWDGVLDPKTYLDIQKSKYKILWILKEPYSKDLIDSDYQLFGDLVDEKKKIEYVINHLNKSPFKNITYVSYAILNDTDYKGVSIIYKEKPSEIAKVFHNIAVINIVKLLGKSTSERKKLFQDYKKWKDIVVEQVEKYKPDIIIGGNILDYLSPDIKFRDTEIKKKLIGVNGHHYFIWNNQLYISAYHPSYKSSCEKDVKSYVNSIVKAVKDWETNYKKH
jgi:hypothetical protein